MTKIGGGRNLSTETWLGAHEGFQFFKIPTGWAQLISIQLGFSINCVGLHYIPKIFLECTLMYPGAPRRTLAGGSEVGCINGRNSENLLGQLLWNLANVILQKRYAGGVEIWIFWPVAPHGTLKNPENFCMAKPTISNFHDSHITFL